MARNKKEAKVTTDNGKLKAALEAAEELFPDTSVFAGVTLEELQKLRDFVECKIESLNWARKGK